MTETTDIKALLLDMRYLAERIIECQGENSEGEEIIHLYDLSDTTFKAENILLVLGALEAERQQREAAEVVALAMRDDMRLAREELAASRGAQDPVAWEWQDGEQRHVTNDEERARDLAWDGVKLTPLSVCQRKPVVVLPEPCDDGHGIEWFSRSSIESMLEAAQIVVKDGE